MESVQLSESNREAVTRRIQELESEQSKLETPHEGPQPKKKSPSQLKKENQRLRKYIQEKFEEPQQPADSNESKIEELEEKQQPAENHSQQAEPQVTYQCENQADCEADFPICNHELWDELTTLKDLIQNNLWRFNSIETKLCHIQDRLSENGHHIDILRYAVTHPQQNTGQIDSESEEESDNEDDPILDMTSPENDDTVNNPKPQQNHEDEITRDNEPSHSDSTNAQEWPKKKKKKKGTLARWLATLKKK